MMGAGRGRLGMYQGPGPARITNRRHGDATLLQQRLSVCWEAGAYSRRERQLNRVASAISNGTT
jgi:hypothetical protein